VQTFTAPIDGVYKLEVWGAQGDGWWGVPGGKGGYAQASYSMNREQIIYISVGDCGFSGHTSWNGGGTNNNSTTHNGGGATSIQNSLISDGQLYHYESVKNTDVLIVAGVGGASEWFYSY
jgi:hypothetical protein